MERNTLAVTNKFWILTSHVCFLDFLWKRGVCGVLGWLAGKVVYRYASFTFLKKLFGFLLKAKEFDMKGKNKTKKSETKKCFLGQKLKSFLPFSPNQPHTLGVVSVTQRLRSPARK